MSRPGHPKKDDSDSGKPIASPKARQALDELFTCAYQELRRMAGSVRRNGVNHTMNVTELVNEAWLKLAGSPSLAGTSILHYKRIAGRAMRQVLVEAARRRHAGKRGAGWTPVNVDSIATTLADPSPELLRLDEALSELELLEPRLGQVVEYRYFGGLDVAETAAVLEVSEATVQRDWRAARAWLKHRLGEPS